MVDYLEPVFSIVVDSRDPVWMVKPKLVSKKYCHILDPFGGNGHFKPRATDNICFLNVAGKVFFQFLDETIFSFMGEAHPCSYTFDLPIFSLSIMIACSKAYGLGEQNGTETPIEPNECAPLHKLNE